MMNLKTIMLSKRHQKAKVTCCMIKASQSIETKRQSMVTWDWEWGLTANGHKMYSVEDDRNALKLDYNDSYIIL